MTKMQACGGASMRVCHRVKCGAKVAQQCGAWVCGPKNAGLPILKHYEIHLRNAQDGYAFAGLKCYSEENLKIHTWVSFGAF